MSDPTIDIPPIPAREPATIALPPVVERPKCRQCEETLRPLVLDLSPSLHADGSEIRSASEDRLLAGGWLPVAGPRPTREDNAAHFAAGGRCGTLRYWKAGRFGYDGDALFCSLRCGYRWAIETVRARGPGPG